MYIWYRYGNLSKNQNTFFLAQNNLKLIGLKVFTVIDRSFLTQFSQIIKNCFGVFLEVLCALIASFWEVLDDLESVNFETGR